MTKEEGFWEVKINSGFLRDNRQYRKSGIEAGLLARQWPVPTPDSNFRLPGMGKSSHHSMPTSIGIDGTGRRIYVQVKPFEDTFSAENEFASCEIAHVRGINTPRAIALMVNDEMAIVVTHLDHLSEALALRDLSFRNVDPRIYTPRDFLADFITATAHMHDQGVVHGDLHPGNIGHQMQEHQPPKVIFFDFEGAEVLGNQDLMDRNSNFWKSGDQKRRLERFEDNAIADLGTFTAYLEYNGFPLPRPELLAFAGQVYTSLREHNKFLDERRFDQMLATNHARVLAALPQTALL